MADPRKAYSTLALRSARRLRALLALAALAWTMPALAQESGREWKVMHKGAVHSTRDTQTQAVEAIKTIPGEAPFFSDSYQYVKEIKDQVVAEDKVTYNYWMGLKQPIVPDWSYFNQGEGTGVPYATQAQAVAAAVRRYNAQSVGEGCPASTTSTAGSWTVSASFGNGQSTLELNAHAFTQQRFSEAEGACGPLTLTERIGRQRIIRCPINYTQWKTDLQACANTDIIVPVVTGPLSCEGGNGPGGTGMVGNPCDVKTGEKYETEPDFDLGWVGFARYYHSGAANSSGGFGNGWSHGHQLRLAISASSVGLIQGSGYQLPFRRVGTDYEATDGSGDRLVNANGQWLLYGADDIAVFDASGRLLERRFENGTKLAYAYDGTRRLDRITHSSGRSIVLQYGSGDFAAPITAVLLDGGALVSYTYTASGQVETATYPGGGVRRYHYEDSRFPEHLTGITAEDNRRFSTFAYDARGRVVSSQHAGGAEGVTLAYRANGGAVVTDALNNPTTYGLTAGSASGPARKIDGVTDSAGTIGRTYYAATVDFRRRLDTLTDRDGTRTKHTYSQGTDAATGVPIRIHSVRQAVGTPQERVRETRTDLASNRPLVSIAGTRETRITRNARLQPAALTIRDTATGKTRTTTYTYCEAADVAAANGSCPLLGLPKTIDGPRTDVADVTTLAYYPSDAAGCASAPASCPHRKGDLWKTTNALGQVIEILRYDGAGRALSVRGVDGVVTDTEYTARGWVSATKLRGANDAVETEDVITRYVYRPTGQVERIVEPNGASATFTYDAAQRLTAVADNFGNSLRYTLDKAGNRLVEDTRDGGGVLKRTLSRLYNPLGQLKTLADAQSNPTDFTYDADGNPNTTTDALRRTADVDHDALGRLTRSVADVGGIAAETRYGYDALDRLASVIDPKGLSTAYRHDALGNLEQLTSPDTGTTQSTHDDAGNLKTRRDARGVTTSYAYDALGRLSAIRYPTGSLDVAFGYDVDGSECTGLNFGRGRLTSFSDGSGRTVLCYNRAGRVKRKVQVVNGQSFASDFSYSVGGDLTQITMPVHGTVVRYGRDGAGRVSTISYRHAGQTSDTVLVSAITYAPFGPIAQITYGNGRTLTRTYDQDYQIDRIAGSGPGGLNLDFTTNAVEAISQIASGAAGNNLQYDALGRLTEVKALNGALIAKYSYDKTGNRTGKQQGTGAVETYGYPAASHRLTTTGTTPRSHDAAGNTVATGARGSIYADHERLVTATSGGIAVKQFAYNARGERVHKYGGTSAEHLFFYDEAGHLLGQYTPATASTSTRVREYVWLGDLPIALLDGAAGQPYYIEPDHLGTPRSMVDPTRNVAVWSWPLLDNPFGELGAISDLDGDGVGIGQPLRFPGQFLDNETGLYQNGYRYFDPGTGRYAESDPIGLNGGISTYAYVNGNPYKNTDRFGLACDHPACYERGGHGQIKMGEANPALEAGFGFVTDFVPVIGDIKGAIEAHQEPTISNITAACVGLIPVLGDVVSKILKNADNIDDAIDGARTLFHYTNQDGMNGILRSGQLRPSLRSINPADVRYGNGQYLSDILPGTRSCAQLSRCFLGAPFQGKRFTNFVEIDISDLNVIKGRDGVFVIPGEEALDIRSRIIRSGEN